MRVYELILAVVLLAALLATLAARNRLRPTCPKCGARRGQKMVPERELSTNDVLIEDTDRLALVRGERRLKVRRQTLLSAVIKCATCGHQYERTRLVQRDVL